jgi:hypothetical protein
MTSNERESTHQPRSGVEGGRPRREETTLKTERIQVERKQFVFTLRENARGRFLRITEDVNGRRDTIIIPAPGLEDFTRILIGMTQAAAEVPPGAAE